MASGRVLIIQNDATENLGLYEAFLRERVEVDVIHAYSMKVGDSFPGTERYSAFIVGPTPISANDVQKHPFLAREWEYLSRVVGSGKPVLGVCCGGQMLARLLGAEVVRSPRKEVGGYTVTLTDAGSTDPLFRGFPRAVPVFHWHSDMFKVPPGGRLLARGDPCPIQAYGWKNVRSVIFHLEIDRREAERWASAYPAELEAVGKTKAQVIEECAVRESEMRHLAEMLVENFLTLG
ncbi:MAG: type 1 glutamine amidotransferase [Candidatus Bathyarchaeota archaeon]|nr:type 1 glutamine amidotransferase [Candidatus Bathyarchaeota archaeon]